MPQDIRPQGYFPQGSFIIPTTAIERRRRLAQELAKTGGSGPVQSWTQGAARLAGALGSVLEEGRASQMEQGRYKALAEALSGGASPDQLMASMDPDLQRIAVYRAQQAQEAAQAERQAAQDARSQSNWQATFDQRAQELNQPDYGVTGGQYFDKRRPEAGAQPIPGYTPEQEPPKASDIMGVVKDYANQPGVKGYRTVAPILGSLQKSLDDPSAVADLDFVSGVSKVLDPNSAVLEGEQGRIISSQSIPQSILGQLNKFMNGEQALTPEARRNLYNLAQRRAGELHAQAETERNFYLNFGKAYGMGEEQFIPLDPLLPSMEAPPATTAPPAGAQAAPTVHKNIPFKVLP